MLNFQETCFRKHSRQLADSTGQSVAKNMFVAIKDSTTPNNFIRMYLPKSEINNYSLE